MKGEEIKCLEEKYGTIYNVERCKIEEDEVSIDYSLFEGNSIEKPIFYISVLKE